MKRASIAATALVANSIVGLAVGMTTADAASPVGVVQTKAARGPVYSFVSMPDYFNSDIGDVRTLDTWKQGDPNSTSPEWGDSVDLVMNTVANEPGDDVLIAGDLVFGHWGVDRERTGLFGPTKTLAQRRQAIRRAGAFYYDRWADRFETRGMHPFPAVGDHDIGDNPWRGPGCYGPGCDWKRDQMGVFKQAWAKQFTLGTRGGHKYGERPVGTAFEDTAYAKLLHPEVLLVTIDVWRRDGADVHAELTQGQLDWMDHVLDTTVASTVIVQGHTPVLRPVRTTTSSGLLYEGGQNSPFWQVLADHDNAARTVMYFAGEAHTVTARQAQGVQQISHGGLMWKGGFNYLTGDVYADGHIKLEIKRMDSTIRTGKNAPKLWSTAQRKHWADVVYHRGTTLTGAMRVDPDGSLATTSGELDLYSAR